MKRRIVLVVLAVIGLAGWTGCADRRPAPAAPEAASPAAVPTVPEEKVGLADAKLGELPALAPTPALPPEPGEAPTREPAYVGSPPVVPHGVDDFTPITRDDNACLGCHLVDEKVEGEATPIPATHFEDLRNAPGVRGDDLAGARWACLACHVAPTDAAPIVRNEF
jgi:cytochrome c-type protein NapB